MRKSIVAAIACVLTMQISTPAPAADFFNRSTMLGWRQQSGPAVVAYFRAPIGPASFTAKARAGLAVTGPRSYAAGETPIYSQGPRILDFAFTRHDTHMGWNSQLAVGNGVAWTNNRESIQPGQVNLTESGLTWVAVGAITVGIAAATFSFIEKETE